MTASISIATRKPRSKRAAKVLILTGADGKYARRDGRHDEYRKELTRRPEPDADFDIAHSLSGGLIYLDYSSNWSLSRNARRSAFTSESPNFVCPVPQRRRVGRARSTNKVTVTPVTPAYQEPPQFDEAGRPIVYKTDDAWNYRIFR